jgi:hypothetical protein
MEECTHFLPARLVTSSKTIISSKTLLLVTVTDTSSQGCHICLQSYVLENWGIKVLFPSTATDFILMQSKQAGSGKQ